MDEHEYKSDQWATGWIEYWKRYYYENHKEFIEKLIAVKNNVDLISQGTIDLLIERNINVFPIQKYTKYFLYDYHSVYLPWEIDGMTIHFSESEVREKYNLDNDIYLETPVFHFHCGLKCLPDDVLQQIVGKDIIDGGASWGDSALVFQEYAPSSIHAFEPLNENYRMLCETQQKSHVDKLVPVHMGLGCHEREETFFWHEMLSGASMIDYKALYWEKDDANKDRVQVTTIDQYVEENDLEVGVIKLDIEGNELEAIRGAMKTICKYKPILLVSVYHLPKDLFEIKPFIESLNLGYEFMFRKLVFHDPLTEVSLIGYVKKE